MAYAYHDLKIKTVAELREIASTIEHEAVQGYTQMNKEHLLSAMCKALGIDMHEHHHVEGVDKAVLKTTIRQLKAGRDKAIEAHDHEALKKLRRRIHGLKRRLHKATV